MFASVALFLECTLMKVSVIEIRGYNLTVYWGGGVLVGLFYAIHYGR
jgi:hypothetical protein